MSDTTTEIEAGQVWGSDGRMVRVLPCFVLRPGFALVDHFDDTDRARVVPVAQLARDFTLITDRSTP